MSTPTGSPFQVNGESVYADATFFNYYLEHRAWSMQPKLVSDIRENRFPGLEFVGDAVELVISRPERSRPTTRTCSSMC